MEKTGRRLDRFLRDGRPLTVWQVECLEKVDPSKKDTVFTEFDSNGFHALRILGPLSWDDPTVPGFFAEECRACSGKFTFCTDIATATILTGKPTGV